MEVIGTSSSDAADSVTAVDDVNIPPLREKYDVFISFRGEDTRLTFTSHLHAAFRRKKIKTYIDYRLERGDEIGPALLEAIEKSRLSVIIFSKNYASSTWCLKELVHILECKKKYGQMVVSIFYDISPSDVRKQKGSYEDAFAELENREDTMDKVNDWKAALVEATGLSGFDYSDKKGTEADFIEEVVEDISKKLKRETSYDIKGMVGIESRIEQVESLLSINDWQGVCTVGIWGMGGIGKTTLAKAVLRRLSSNFEAACFLKNVREKSEQIDGADQLQNTLIREILKEENLSMDKKNVQERLSRTKVLIVFDDVSDSRQIKDLAGDNLRYGNGSRIIVTSRERSVLMKAVSDEKYIYKVEKIKTDDALQLFQFHVFKDNSPREEYTELSARAVKYAGGIPLALEVLGSLLFPCKSKDEWEDALSALRDDPNEEIQNTFRVSYNRLERHAQEVFLDIACFRKGKHIEDVKKMLDFGQLTGGSRAADGIRVLRDRSLISIDSERDTVDMHDLVQEMGWAIVREQCIEEPGRRSRLFVDEDIYHVLKNNTGTEKVQAIYFNWSMIAEQNLDRADFKKMYNMRLLSVNYWIWGKRFKTLSLPNSLRYLFWKAYPLKSLPPEFSLENLVELHMPWTKSRNFGMENPINLKVIKLHRCKRLTALPNLLGSPNIEHMDLSDCESLVEIPQYFKNLDKLTYLDLSRCKLLKYLPEMPRNIESLRLQGSGIKELASSVWSHEKISSLYISDCKELKDLSDCESLVEIPQYFKNLDKLTYLDLSWCKLLKYLPEMPRNIESLELQGSGIKELPSSVWSHEKISSLYISDCKELKELPSYTCKLKVSGNFRLWGCSSLEKFWELPRGIGELDLSFTAIKLLPTSSMECLYCLTTLKLGTCKNLGSLPRRIWKLKSLEVLDLNHCSELKVVPSSIYKLKNLKYLSFAGCCKLQNFPQPTGSVGFLSLEVLDLNYSGILEIPEALIWTTSLREIELSGTKIRSLPSSIKQASQLSCLGLYSCKSLRSLPELPMLGRLEADNCKSLKTVSSSRTAITQCWNRYELLQQGHTFLNCPSLGHDARSSIMVDAQLRIMRVATAASKDESSKPLVAVACPGSELPNWFVHQNEGASINVTLPANWFREGFLGFAPSVVLAEALVHSRFRCKYTFKTEEGESHKIKCWYEVHHFAHDYSLSRNVCVWYKDLKYEEGAKWSSAFYDRVTEVSVRFKSVTYVATYDEFETYINHDGVKKCGIHLLYAEDAEKLKFDVMSLQEQDEPAASRSGDPEASGSDDSEESSGSDEFEEASGIDDYEEESGSDEGASDESEEASGSDESEQASGSDESVAGSSLS